MNVLRMWTTAVVELDVIIWLVPSSVSVHLVLQEMVAHAQVITMVLESLILYALCHVSFLIPKQLPQFDKRYIHVLCSAVCANVFSNDYLISLIADINECAEDLDDCHPDADCTNTIGSYQCRCRPGFTGNGRQCQLAQMDVNECAGGRNNCSSNAICIDRPNGFTCQCRQGFSGDGVTCDGGWSSISFLSSCLSTYALHCTSVKHFFIKKVEEWKHQKKV